MKYNSKTVIFYFKTIRDRNAEIRKLLNILKKISTIKNSHTSALKNRPKVIDDNLMKKGDVIRINFRTKKRRNPKMDSLLKEVTDYALGKIKNDNHLLRPGPDCYSKDEIISHIKDTFIYSNPKAIDKYKIASDHIFSCKRCRALFLKVSNQLGKVSIPELRIKSVAELVFELF